MARFHQRDSPRFPEAAPEWSPKLTMSVGFLAAVVDFAPTTLLMLLVRLLLWLLLVWLEE